MLKWLIALLITVLVAGVFLPRLAAFLRIGRLPGDVRFKINGKEVLLPFASTVVLSLALMLLARLF